jgi:hypothetical protein
MELIEAWTQLTVRGHYTLRHRSLQSLSSFLENFSVKLADLNQASLP